MAQFSTPASPSRSVLNVDTFLGVDYTNAPANVDVRQSPNGQNMIRDVPGKVRKCMGYQTVSQFEGPIHGAYFLYGEDSFLVHAGTSLYTQENVPIYSDMADRRSKAWQFEDVLYIADGKKLLVYNGSNAVPASENAKIPLLTIAKSPSGGGTPYEDLNLIQPGFTEKFLGTETDTQYQMSFTGLDNTPVTAQKMGEDGTWLDLTENTDFTVNRETGVITFTAAPGKSPLTGEDNVSITAYRTVSGYADRINHCRYGILFGVKGASDRLFLSGNPDFPNYDWYSERNDPSYWPDTAYSVLGSSSSAIVGYSVINDKLAAHKDSMEADRNVILREGTLQEDGSPSFPVVNALQGAGAIAPYSFAYLCTEPLFLTSLGVYAITPQDITGERYAQNRSFYLNGKLLEEAELEEAYAFVYKDLYWLCLNGCAYILDGLQPVSTDKSAPYSTRQYVGFYRTNFPARVLWQFQGDLYFGTPDGKVCRMYSDPESLLSFNDDGRAIHAVWETPDLSGKLFYKNKSFRYLALRLASAVVTSVRIWGQRRGLWYAIKEENTKIRYFSFSNLSFEKFSFSNDTTPKTIHTKTRIKKVDKARFRFENTEINEPFGLFDFALEYVESGNYKG